MTLFEPDAPFQKGTGSERSEVPVPLLKWAVLTIGHSNRPIDEFLRLLEAHGATLVADVRKLPGSRANPQFNSDALADKLSILSA